MAATAAEVQSNIRPGTYVIATTEDTQRSVWFYVITPLGGNRAFGVSLGVHREYVQPEAGQDGLRFTTGTVDTWNSAESLDTLGEVVSRALVSFLVGHGLPDPTKVQEATPEEALEEARQQGRREARAEAEQEFERWKARATSIAHDYANRNSLCSEFDRCMEEIGLPGRSREYSVEVHVCETTTVVVVASSEEEAEELVSDDPWNYLDIYSLRDSAEVEVQGAEVY